MFEYNSESESISRVMNKNNADSVDAGSELLLHRNKESSKNNFESEDRLASSFSHNAFMQMMMDNFDDGDDDDDDDDIQRSNVSDSKDKQ